MGDLLYTVDYFYDFLFNDGQILATYAKNMVLSELDHLSSKGCRNISLSLNCLLNFLYIR